MAATIAIGIIIGGLLIVAAMLFHLWHYPDDDWE